MNYIRMCLATAATLLLSSCGTYFNQPLSQKAARSGEKSYSTQNLLELPPAQQPVEVAVYNFSDQTGQYKAIETGSTFSTAVTQGGTTILIKALEDSGWFKPIERENLSNLSTERNIIRNTKQEYIKNLNPNEPPLPPLLYAGLLLEGGIISYDTNVVTGGFGARYFGVGGSAKYRQDRISVYLRAVSTNNGQILKTVYVTKTILSQALDANFFRFVKFQRLLEAETGITKNEPVQLAVKDAIEKAVHDLIIEGIKDGYWNSQQGKNEDTRLVNEYLAEKEAEESMGLHDRKLFPPTKKNYINLLGGTTINQADYSTKNPAWNGKLGVGFGITPHFSIENTWSFFRLDSGEQFTSDFISSDINLAFNLLPQDDLAPYVYVGGGLIMPYGTGRGSDISGKLFYKLQYGGGLTYRLNDSWSLKGLAEHNLSTSDLVDGLENGRRNDHYLAFALGLAYKFNF